MYSRHQSALGLVQLYSVGGCSAAIVIKFVLLLLTRGDTAIPDNRLNAMLCHTFLVSEDHIAITPPTSTEICKLLSSNPGVHDIKL